MTDSTPHFENENASSYDARATALAPIKDAMHLASELLLRNLPKDAHILCVGAGTGAEIDYLARRFKGWHFTAVDPAAEMLAQARAKAEAGGYAGRCTFQTGTTDSLPKQASFHAATAFLVSQFMADHADRVAFFREIVARLVPGGTLLSVDLTTEQQGQDREDQIARWVEMSQSAGFPVTRESFDGMVTLLTPEKIATILEDGGFAKPHLFFQFLLMHGWIAQKPGPAKEQV